MREILMIDDKFAKWEPVLGQIANKYNFSLINAPSIEEGLEKIQNYPETIEAIVLGLTFPENQMQGKEGLLKIKDITALIPVIILTAKTDDIQLISECIRLGAYDYFSKPKLNPEALFLQIERAIDEFSRRKKFINFTQNAIDPNAAIPKTVSISSNDETITYFAYKLNAISVASQTNKADAEQFCKLAAEWHFNFLNTFSLYDSSINLRLRYIYKPGNKLINIFLIIEFTTPSQEHSIIKFEDIHTDFDLFMQSKKEYGKTVYYFTPVVDEPELNTILRPFKADTLVQFIPEFIEYNLSKKYSVGFSTKREEDKPNFSPPSFQDPDIKLDSFLEQLANQKTNSIVDIVATPQKLTREQIDYLREKFNDINLLPITTFEKENASRTISDYLQAPSKCFKVEVFEAQESKAVGKNMISAISTSFFGSAKSVKLLSHKTDQNIVLKAIADKSAKSSWQSLYSFNNIINIFKLPFPLSSEIPGIKMYNRASGYLPENICTEGILMGVKDTGLGEFPIKISTEDLRKHMYILGQTGTGKTTLLYTMIMDSINSGKGVCVIDPHGDLHRKLLYNIPKERRKDIIRFEPGFPGNKIRINLLEYSKENPLEKSFLIDDLFNFFRQEYDPRTMGPQFEMYMKNALLLIMDNPEEIGTIGDVSKVFQDTSFREELLKKCSDEEVVHFWRKTAVNTVGEQSLVNFDPYVTSKLNQLLTNEFIRPIVTTPKSNINFREILDNNKIFLVSLTKGQIGKIGVNILGTIILSRIINAAMSRQELWEEYRKEYIMFVDEFQNFMSNSLTNAISEVRKYKLSLVLANQNLGQLNENMRQSVLGNVGSTVIFRPGVNDVDNIMPYYEPYLTRDNVLTLPNYKCIGRFLIENTLSQPFIFDTIPPEKMG